MKGVGCQESASGEDEVSAPTGESGAGGAGVRDERRGVTGAGPDGGPVTLSPCPPVTLSSAGGGREAGRGSTLPGGSGEGGVTNSARSRCRPSPSAAGDSAAQGSMPHP